MFKRKSEKGSEFDLEEAYKGTYGDDEEDAAEEVEMDLQSRLREIQKGKNKKEQFIKTRMWFATAIAKFYPDRVQIPANIGNNVFIGHNQIVTKYSISSMIAIKELSDRTPISLFSEVIKKVKREVPGIYVDVTIKNTIYRPDTNDKGLVNRSKQWTRTMNNKVIPERLKTRAAKLLYTLDVAKSREQRMFRSQIYFIIRAQDGLHLRNAQRSIESALSKHGITYVMIRSKAKDHLEHISMLNNKSGALAKGIPTIITSATLLAELLPAIQGMNDDKGNYLGLNKRNNSPYLIDFRGTNKGKNIWVIGVSGEGKTFLVLNWLLDAFAIGYNICAADIKGNEIVPLCEAVGGSVISLRPESDLYINTLRLDREAVREGQYATYFNNMFDYTLQMMIYAAAPEPGQETATETLLSSLLVNIYKVRGILRDNPNTWNRSSKLNPKVLYEELSRFISKDHHRRYGQLCEVLLERFKNYFSEQGQQSYMFGKEMALSDAYAKRMVVFDFGLLNSEGMINTASFKIRNMFMNIANDGYVLNNARRGIWTMKALEESQIATDQRDMYSREVTLRRSQKQVTIILGNSAESLADDPSAKSIIDNINILVMGKMNKSSRKFLINEFDLHKKEDLLDSLAENPDYEHTFLLVNKMQKHASDALIRAYVPSHIAKKRLFTTMTSEEE